MSLASDLLALHFKDYPAILYWFKHQYLAAKTLRDGLQSIGIAGRGPARSAQGENVKFWFLQQEDGTVVDGHTISRMRHTTKSIWKTIDSSTPMGSPWTSVSAAHQQEFYRLIEAKYPFLRFCECHYKADAIAHKDYLHWYSRKEGKKSGGVSKARLQKRTLSKTKPVDPPIPSKRGSHTPSTPPTSHTTHGPRTLESSAQISGASQSSPVPAQRNPSTTAASLGPSASVPVSASEYNSSTPLRNGPLSTTTARQQTPSPTHLLPENIRAPNIHDDATTTPSIIVGALTEPHGVRSDAVLTESHTPVITVCVFSYIVLHR